MDISSRRLYSVIAVIVATILVSACDPIVEPEPINLAGTWTGTTEGFHYILRINENEISGTATIHQYQTETTRAIIVTRNQNTVTFEILIPNNYSHLLQGVLEGRNTIRGTVYRTPTIHEPIVLQRSTP
jgi:hypothetical protein